MKKLLKAVGKSIADACAVLAYTNSMNGWNF